MAPPKINIKERLSEGEIDLSMSDLQDVPVKDIAVFKKAFSLDLSNNHLKSLAANFIILTHITKLDLSKNLLIHLPENFGDLVKLKYLDLYQNKLQNLPISFNKLKALKWLDLKDNPLEPPVGKVAGPCLDAKQCQTCARDVVSFFTQVQEQIDTRQKEKQKQLELIQQKEMENKKNKKKEKAKQKKENGPVRENVPKSSNKKNKKATVVEKKAQKPSSIFKSFFAVIVFTMILLFILTSVKYEHTRVIEEKCIDLYNTGMKSLPPNLHVYFTTAGGYIKILHDKTGNATIATVNYVKNTDNLVHICSTVNEYVKAILQKVKEQYKKYVS